jgi:iron(III) transport system permease protein
VPLAWLTTRTDLPMRRTIVVITALPLAIPTYVGGYTFVSALGPRGLVQDWLEPLGVDRLPSIYGFRGAWLVLTLFTYPYVLLTVRSALRHLDPSIEEASRTLGHGRMSTFARVVLPQLRPSIAAGGLLVALYTLSDFGAVSLLRFDSFTRVIFTRYRASLDLSAVAVYGLMLVALTALVLAVEQRTRGAEQYHQLHGGTARVTTVISLGRWRWAAFAACVSLTLIALVLPMGVITFWLVRGIERGRAAATHHRAHRQQRAGIAARRPRRHRGRVAGGGAVRAAAGTGRHRLIEGLSWSGYALPGVVVALSLVFFGARVATPLYQTMWMLTFAYVVLFLPQAIGALRSSMLQVTPSLEEASRLLGAGPFTTFRRVVLPLVRSGATAGALLVFLTCMKELPATLLLAPTGYRTLATQVYNASVEAFFARAAAPALALVVLSALPMAALIIRDNERS